MNRPAILAILVVPARLLGNAAPDGEFEQIRIGTKAIEQAFDSSGPIRERALAKNGVYYLCR
jgi:hypothetical protein